MPNAEPWHPGTLSAMGSWTATLRSMASRGAAPTGALAKYPRAIELIAQSGPERDTLPPPVQDAIARLVAGSPRGYISGLDGSAIDVLEKAASYAGLQGVLLERILSTRQHRPPRALAENPKAPPTALRRLARRRRLTEAILLIANPTTPTPTRRRLFGRVTMGTRSTVVEQLCALPEAELHLLAKDALRAARIEKPERSPDATRRIENGMALARPTCGSLDVMSWCELLINSCRAAATWKSVELGEILTDAVDAELFAQLCSVLERESSQQLTMVQLADALDEFRTREDLPTTKPGWAARPNLNAHLHSLALGDREAAQALLSPYELVRRCVLERPDLDDTLLRRALDGAVDVPFGRITSLFARLSPQAKFDVIDEMMTLPVEPLTNEIFAFLALATEELSGTQSLALAERAFDTATRYETRQQLIFWRAFLRVHPDEGLAPLQPARAMADLAPGNQVAAWLEEQLTGDQLAVFFSLVDDFEGTAGELVETCRALESPNV